MSWYVDRDSLGNVTARYAVQQYAGQEYISDGTPAMSALQLIDVKAAKVSAIESAYGAAVSAGFTYNATVYQIDDISQQRIAAWGSLANVSGMAWPSNFVWVAANNTRTPFATAATFLAFAEAAATRVTAMILNARALKDAVAAAQTVADLTAIDSTKGW